MKKRLVPVGSNEKVVMKNIERLLHQAAFLQSAQTLAQCPADEGGEVAFAGRSNAGKSSAINRLTGQKTLARTSKTPGRTQLINLFQLDEQRRLVDLPGYGYAKVDKEKRNQWQRDLDSYLSGRKSLVGMVLLMDIRNPLKEHDVMLIEWAEKTALPLHVLLTKADKLSFGAAKQALFALQKSLNNYSLPISSQLFSSTSGLGLDAAFDLIGEWLQVEENAADTTSQPR